MRNLDSGNEEIIKRTVKIVRFLHTVSMKTLLEQAKDLQEKLIETRRYLHENAETGFSLKKTIAYIQKQLEDMGYTPKKCGRAGLVAEIGKGEETLLLRADMDGLPIQEKTGLSYACKRGNMHACGHDFHATMLLGAAELLKTNEKKLQGKIRLLFQPAEELLEGAKDCISGGVLEGVSSALMLHVLTAVELPSGAAVVASGGVSAPAADFFTIEVQGKSCHGSAPWKGVDALTVAARILLGLQEISSREVSPADAAVLTVVSLQAGKAGNVLCDRAILQGTLRSFDEKTRDFIKTRIEKIAKQTATAFRARAKISYGGGCPTLVNDDELSKKVLETAKKLLGKNSVFASQELDGDTRKNSGGSEDFAYVSHAVPSVMVALAAGEKGKGYEYPLHHAKAKFDENVLCIGAALYAAVAQNIPMKA